MKLKSLIIATAQLLGETGRIRLTFKGLPATMVAIKPIGTVTGRLSPAARAICEISPDNLVGATVTVSDTIQQDGTPVAGVMETFKAGDKYLAQAINSAVVNQVINPATGKPTQIGDELTTTTDGLRLQGAVNVELHPDVLEQINTIAMSEVIKSRLHNRTSSRASRTATATINAGGAPALETDENGNALPLVDQPLDQSEIVNGNPAETQPETPAEKKAREKAEKDAAK